MNWIEFWSTSAEIVNHFLRFNFENNTLFEYYISRLKLMENIMFCNSLNQDITVYRNICFDYYEKIETQINESTFLSCFLDCNNEEYGRINLEILVPKNCPFLFYDNVIILPKSTYEIVKKGKHYYLLKLINYEKIF